MDFHIDPNASLADIQLACFMAAITALVELARTTNKDHIKLRALTEVARLCNPAKRPTAESSSPKPPLSPRRGGSSGFTPSPTPSTPAPAPLPTPHGTPIASAGPQAPDSSLTARQPQAPVPVARSSEGAEFFTPSTPPHSSCSTPNLNRRQRRLLARLEANDRKREHKQRIAA